jgi:hypothetical protein
MSAPVAVPDRAMSTSTPPAMKSPWRTSARSSANGQADGRDLRAPRPRALSAAGGSGRRCQDGTPRLRRAMSSRRGASNPAQGAPAPARHEHGVAMRRSTRRWGSHATSRHSGPPATSTALPCGGRRRWGRETTCGGQLAGERAESGDFAIAVSLLGRPATWHSRRDDAALARADAMRALSLAK